MIITLQSRPCPTCRVENVVDASQCHSCGRSLRCPRAQVLEMATPEASKARPKILEKSLLGHCVAKIDALLHPNRDISTLKFD